MYGIEYMCINLVKKLVFPRMDGETWWNDVKKTLTCTNIHESPLFWEMDSSGGGGNVKAYQTNNSEWSIRETTSNRTNVKALKMPRRFNCDKSLGHSAKALIQKMVRNKTNVFLKWFSTLLKFAAHVFSFWTIAFRYIQIGVYWVECIENSKYRKTWWLGRSSRVNPNLGHKHASDRHCRRPKIPVKLGASFWCFALQTKQAVDRSWNLAFLTLHSSKGDVSCLPSTSTLSNFKLGEVGEVENSWISTPSRTKDPWPARMARRWVTSSECMLEEWHVGGTDFAFALMQCELSFLAWTCAEHVDLMGAQLQRKEPQVRPFCWV